MLTIRKIILYKHGVAYFERQGTVDGDATLELAFKKAEMNDVLKSLTVMDLSGGLIQSISYEATQPVERQLEEIALTLSDNQALSGLLAQIKGARVAVEIGSRQVEGVVTGIEQRVRRDDKVTSTEQLLTLLVDGESLYTLKLEQAKRIHLLDASLKKDLQHLLDVHISTKKKDLKKLTIYTKGEGERTLLAGYIVEAPVWKTSYRILLDEDRQLIQGWALVDNTGDEDWDDVVLTLVAGLPVSFVHDLYSPRYKKRPVVKVEEEAAYAPPQLEAAVATALMEDVGDMADEDFAVSAAAAPMKGAAMMQRRGAGTARAQARKRSLPVQTRTAEIGDSFQYEIQTPVTVKRNQSALVPILLTAFEGRRVAVYNPEVREKNPLSAVLLKNTTGLMLEGGPLTVFEQDTYLGESMLDTLKPDEERLVPYSVELGCVISVDHHSERRDVHRITILNGSISLLYYQLEQTLYVINNKTEHILDLFLEHRFERGWELEETPQPVEQTEHFYRFRLDAPAARTTRFTVTEKYQQRQVIMLDNLDRRRIHFWAESRYIDDPVRQALEDFIAQSEGINTLQQQIKRAEQDIEHVFKNQERLRQNLKALGSADDEKGLRERYVAELAAEEDKLRDSRAEIRQWQDEKQALEHELAAAIKRFSYEGTPVR